MNVDFSGYVTKNDVTCSDGRKIRKDAFQHNDGNVVPLVWQHLYNDPEMIIGKIFLENREDGVYGYGALNHTDKAETMRKLLEHGDITSMSIHANKLIERNGEVFHGDIKEVSLVVAGANPEATIEHVTLHHSDGMETELDDEAVIHHSGIIDSFDGDGQVIDLYDQDGTLQHADDEEDGGTSDGETIAEIFDTLTDKQKNVVYAMIGAAVEDASSSKTTESTEDKTMKQSDIDEGGKEMKTTRPFETNGKVEKKGELTHSELENLAKEVFADCQNNKTNFKDALMHAAKDYGIENIEILFPDAQTVTNAPEFVKRRTEWVSTVLSGTKHSPFSRIKSIFADITADEARARGYIKGNQKIEEVFPVMSRTTTPQTIYKKQKLDRDDIIDITSFDVVAWLRAEMRVMLDEEIARAILVGDGRLVTSTDKIKEEHIRPIWTDDNFYAYHMELAKTATLNDLADAFVRVRNHYEGSGRPVTFMSPETVTDLMLQRDSDGKRLYKTEQELADALRVSKIIEVPIFSGLTRKYTPTGGSEKTVKLNAIVVNLADYTVGADKGGQVTMFDDFDIDYNQYKYLIETRISGALTGYHSAIVIETDATATANK